MVYKMSNNTGATLPNAMWSVLFFISIGLLQGLVKAENNCNAEAAPPGGSPGNCTAVVKSDEWCLPICNDGLTAKGLRSCVNGQLLDTFECILDTACPHAQVCEGGTHLEDIPLTCTSLSSSFTITSEGEHLQSLVLPCLEEVAGSITIRDNKYLRHISMPRLRSVTADTDGSIALQILGNGESGTASSSGIIDLEALEEVCFEHQLRIHTC